MVNHEDGGRRDCSTPWGFALAREKLPPDSVLLPPPPMVSPSSLAGGPWSLLDRLQQLPENRARPLAVSLLVFGSAFAYFAVKFRGNYDHVWEVPGLALRYVSTGSRVVLAYVARGCKPRFDGWTLRFEYDQALSRCLASYSGDRISRPEVAAEVRRQAEIAGRESAPGIAGAKGLVVRYFEFNGLRHTYVVSPLDASKPKPKHRVVVLYYHGGGYVACCPDVFVATATELQTRIHKRLAQKLGHDIQVDVLLANYRKAPQFPYPHPPQDAHTMYKYLLNQEKVLPSQIIVMGDSAGAGLTLTTLLRVRDENPKQLPLAGILLYPFIDPEFKGDERKNPYCMITDRGNKGLWDAYLPVRGDPTKMGDAYPLYCNMSGLPPVYIVGAELDYILSHSKKLMEKAVRDGQQNWKLEIFPEVAHGFVGFPEELLASAAKGLDAVSEYAATHFYDSLKSF